jgi:UDP-N-acetylglucosamine 1-carboxyvinyltransferase
MDEASVTATENALMAAALDQRHDHPAQLRQRAPRLCGLARMLVAMGAHIDGIGTNTLRHPRRRPPGRHRPRPVESDYLEIGSFIGLAAVTRSDLTIHKVMAAEHLRMIRMTFEKLGIITSTSRVTSCIVPPASPWRSAATYHGHVPKIDDAPWPAFPTDLMSIVITVATQCKGTVLFFEKMFEGRMFFVDHLQNMGAQIILCDPHRVVVVGRRRCAVAAWQSPDVRAGMALLIAAPRLPRARRRCTTSTRSTAAMSAWTRSCGPSARRSSACPSTRPRRLRRK